jgi:Na+/H+ antiporter NhaC
VPVRKLGVVAEGEDLRVENWGLWSLTPLLVTLVLAFVTRSALIAMLLGTFTGTLMLGTMPGVRAE